MSQLDDLPDVPSGPSDPFAAPPSGGYLGSNDDDEIRKIRRRVSPLGKLVIVAVLIVGGGTGYFLWNTAREEAAVAKATTDGRSALAELVRQPLPRDELARRVREAYAQYRVAPEVRMSARRILAGLHDDAAMPLFIEGLHETGRERSQAALAVAEIGMPAASAAREALNEALPHTDPAIDRAEVTWAMVVAEDPRAWDTVVSMLGDGTLQRVNNLDDPPRRIFDPGLVARMAGRDRLVRLANDSHPGVKRVVAVSLAELASPEVFDALVTLSRDADADVAREAAIGLGRTGLDRAGEPIVAYLNGHPDARDGVLNSLSSNAGAPALGVVMRTATDPTTRSQATRLLRELQDPGSGDAFMAVLSAVPADATDETLRNTRKNAIFGLAEIGDPRAADGLIELVQRPLQPGARVDPNADQDARLAIDVLRKIPHAPARAKAQLLAILPRADFMRTQILLALGDAEDPSLGAQIMTYLTDVNAQEGAAVAVCRLNYGPGIARVRADMRRPPNLNMSQAALIDEPVFVRRRNAMHGIAWTHDRQYAPDLMRIIEDPQDRDVLREEAGHALSAVADDATVTEIATRALDTARPEDVRLYYLYALRSRSNAETSNRLIEAYIRPGASGNLMRAAAIAGGFGGDATTAAAVVPLLASTDANVKLAAGIAAVLSGDGTTANTLLDQLGTNREFSELLTNSFVTRSAAGNNTGMQLEPYDMLPLTQSMFTDGRIYRRIELAAALEHGHGTVHQEFAMTWLKLRLKNGWENPLGIGPFEVRQALREAAQHSGAAGTPEAQHAEQAFRMLRALNDRGSLLWLRRQTGPSAERARRELVEMNTTTN